MRCSLLALSSYIDTELDVEPSGELEAHLIGCERCSTAIVYLREETERIGGLARVHVPDDAVHELFSQIGLIAEEDDLPRGPVHRDRPAPVEAPPWFGAERGKALPWAPLKSHDAAHGAAPRELIGERSSGSALAEPPELFLWDDDSIDQIATAPSPTPPAVRVVPNAEPAAIVDIEPAVIAPPEPVVVVPQPPEIMAAEPQPPDLSTSAFVPVEPRRAVGPNALQRARDAMAVRLALWRGAGSRLDSGVEITSGTGAPKWNERAHTQPWSDVAPIVVAEAPAVLAPPVVAPQVVATNVVTPPAVVPAIIAPRLTTAEAPAEALPTAAAPSVPTVIEQPDAAPMSGVRRLSRFWSRTESDDVPVEATASVAARRRIPEPHDIAAPTGTPALADVLSEVAALAAPLERAATPKPFDEPEPSFRPSRAPVLDRTYMDTGVPVQAFDEPEAPPMPGRHVRRLRTQKPERRDWNPTQPVTGRHVLPIGGPAVGAADRDRRLWVFGAITLVVMLIGLLIGRQVIQTSPLVASTIPRSTPAAHATTPPTATATLPVATPAPTAVIPSAPTPGQLTGSKTLGTGAGGFSVADVRYGEHPNDFRLVFDLAFPTGVTGEPGTVIGYDGPTTLYLEFTGVDGTSPIKSMPPGQIVVSVVPLPMARNTGRLIFKITLSKNAPFDAYYLSGGRLIIDVT
jgi:hypothetical protein